jgi:glycosyltransferase involved in cell wall biosynthesis
MTPAMTPAAPDVRVVRLDDVAVVAIGRNEGVRLEACLRSVTDQVAIVIYVDSGSTDRSAAMAGGLGAQVIHLDLATPFTAARARNAGFLYLLERFPEIAFVQFVDGDCEVERQWLQEGRRHLLEHASTAAVFGRRRERFPSKTVYNRIVDEEWTIAPGEVKYCGGDVMMRTLALQQAGGYRASLIAGEEPELCVRLRQFGWKIVCRDHAMTMHDVALNRFGQWWRRMVRSGYAYAAGAYLHGAPPERHWVAETRRIWIWAAAIPAAIILILAAAGPWALTLATLYPVQVTRLYLNRKSWSAAPLGGAILLVVGKFPEFAGQLRFLRDLWRGKEGRLIEYK